jgi:hypothetical protein
MCRPRLVVGNPETPLCSCEASLFWCQWLSALRRARKRLSTRISNVLASPSDTRSLMQGSSVSALTYAKPA